MGAFEVVGFRSSFADSVEAKRVSNQIMDTITAEQIGEFGSQNIGEAIQRISGVSLTRNNGEGEFITVRGLAPEFTRVEIDGRSTAMTADQSNPGREVLLSVFDADLYRSIDVIKSPTAADVEGGVGGTVRLKTPDPIALGKMHWRLQAALTDADVRDRTEYTYKAFFSDTYLEGRLGVLVNATYSKRDRRLDKVQTGDPVWNRVTSSDPDLDGGRYPGRLRLEQRSGDMPKFNLNAKVQFQATPQLQLYANTVLTREERNEDKSRIQVDFQQGGVFQTGTIDPATGTLVAAEFQRHRVDLNDFTRETNVNTTGVTGGFIWESGLWKIEGKVNDSDSKEDFDEYTVQARINRDGIGGYELGDDPRTPRLYTAATLLAPSAISLRGLSDDKRIISIGESEMQADVSRTLTGGMFNLLKFGLRGAETEFTRRQGGPPSPSTSGLTFADGVSPFVLHGDFGFGKGGSDFLTQWPEVDAKEMFLRYAPGGTIEFDNSNLYTIREKNRAGYVMAAFENRLGPALARGNLGVRLVKTEYKGSGRVTLSTPSQTYVLDDEPALEGDYTKALPAFNLLVRPHADSRMQIRAAITRAMTRPTVTQINPSTSIDTTDLEVSRGNPELSPFLAWQYDLGLEWYFGQSGEGLFAIAAFDKDVENFIVPSTTTGTFAFPDQGVPSETYTISSFRNGGEASVRGIEVNLQSPFTFLPGLLGNFGGAVNYTYTDSQFTDAFGNTFSFPGASRSTYNLVLYYEQKGFSTRLAYNRRDDYLIAPSETADGANALYGEGQGRLDLSVRYSFKNGLRLSFDALNLTEEQAYKFYDIPQRYQNFEFEGRIFAFSVGYSH